MSESDQEHGSAGLSIDTSRKVVRAIEESIPLYDSINDLISFGGARPAREYAIRNLGLVSGVVVLDAGIGPGTTSELIMHATSPSLLVGLDASVKQLETAKLRLGSAASAALQLVRGSFEFLPFRSGVFDAIITCFALRDSLDIPKSIAEYQRVCAAGGVFADVDLGKPDDALKRFGSTLYINYLMPLLAKAAIRGRIRGNPWRMIVPTYKTLPRNTQILSWMASRFSSIESKDFLLGGVTVIVARKPS